MFESFLVAAKYRDLAAVVAVTWRALTSNPGPEAPGVADAIAQAVLADDAQHAEPAPYSPELRAALLAEFAYRESGIRAHPCLHSKLSTCGDSGKAHGYWQLHQPAGEDVAVRQAEVWLALLRQSSQLCPERPLAMVASGLCDRGTKLADSRLKVAEAAVTNWRNGERPPEAPGEASAAVPAAAVAPAGGTAE